jgi:hypothetical protein
LLDKKIDDDSSELSVPCNRQARNPRRQNCMHTTLVDNSRMSNSANVDVRNSWAILENWERCTVKKRSALHELPGSGPVKAMSAYVRKNSNYEL